MNDGIVEPSATARCPTIQMYASSFLKSYARSVRIKCGLSLEQPYLVVVTVIAVGLRKTGLKL